MVRVGNRPSELLFVLCVCLLLSAPVSAQAGDDDRTTHFERFVRPVFVERCHQCHAGEKHKGGLRLDSSAGLNRGGESGAVVVPGSPDVSLLIQAVRHEQGLRMPPDGRLSERQISDIAQWIRDGAHWPSSEPSDAPSAALPAAVRPLPPDHAAMPASLRLWLRADNLELADGDVLPVWPDSSTHRRDLTAVIGVPAKEGGEGEFTPPRYVRESSLERRPGVRFELASGLSGKTGDLFDASPDSAFSIIAVVRLPTRDIAAGHQNLLGFRCLPPVGLVPGIRPATLVSVNGDGEQELVQIASEGTADEVAEVSLRLVPEQPAILTMIRPSGATARQTRVFVNGQPLAVADEPVENDPGRGPDDASSLTTRHPEFPDASVWLGRTAQSPAGFQGDVGELLVYSEALTEFQRRSVEAHLADKFGIVAGGAEDLAPLPLLTPAEREFWAFQPVRDAPLPAVRDHAWVQSPVDRFILSRLEQMELSPAPPADRLTLLRRVTFDLTGLPPTPEEAETWLGDTTPAAFERVVERLLTSPHYGERWARHWLDVVRYAETTANDANAVMRYADRYRNYVIDALNTDMPYDQFIVEQLAGDLLPTSEDPEATARRIIATGYLMIGPRALAETDKEQSRLDIVDDQIDVTGRTFLGLTLACARCHDHKFDAIRAVDYYALAGIFRSTEPFQNEIRNASMWWEYPVPAGPGRDPIMVMAPREALPRHLRVQLRGNRFTPGPLVRRGPVHVVDAAAFPDGDRAGRPDFSVNNSGRLALAEWISSPRNPLTARVMVNRIWQHHFGRGLVTTSDNFGTRGDRPTHPELLDWLAVRFVESGWSIQTLHRLMLCSATWQQQSLPNSAVGPADPDGRWLSYMPRRRLSAEELRDAILAVSGQLDSSVGGYASGEFLFDESEDIKAMIRPNRVPADHPWYTSFAGRSIYLPIVRNILPDVLNLFDAADPNGVTAVRNETTVPGQSLFLLNSEFLRQQARYFAARLDATGDAVSPKAFAARIDQAQRLVTGRGAAEDDVAEARRFISDYQSHPVLAGRTEAECAALAWQSYCQALLCGNDFLYVE